MSRAAAKNRQSVIQVIIVAFDNVQLLDFAGPLQTFATARERRAEDNAPNCRNYPDYDVRLVSRGGGAVKSSSGVTVITDPLPKRIAPGATIIVAGGYGVDAAADDLALRDWLQRHAPRAARVCSVCTGAFVLAAAGLLDGKRATTHWADCARFKSRFPTVKVQPDAIYTRDDGAWTSAGITAGIDLALALIEEDWNAHLATATARWLVVYAKRPGGQSQFSDVMQLAARDAGGAFDGLHNWMAANLTADLSLANLAAQAGMSERSLSRRYTDIIGVTPARAVKLLRAERARALLTGTSSSLKSVARRSGFGSVEAMNRALDAAYGVSAALLRETG